MAEFRLSRRARDDLLAIYTFTDARFGRFQAEAYHAGLEHSFMLLADFPGIGASVDDVLPACRRFRFQSHHIFYTQEADYVLIRALIHVRQNIRPELFE